MEQQKKDAEMKTAMDNNAAQIKKLEQKLESMSGKPNVSVVCEELIDFVQQMEDPLLFDKKNKAQSQYRKRKGM